MPIQQINPRFADFSGRFFKGFDQQSALNQQNRFANLKEDQINQQNRLAQQRSDLSLKQDARADRTAQMQEIKFENEQDEIEFNNVQRRFSGVSDNKGYRNIIADEIREGRADPDDFPATLEEFQATPMGAAIFQPLSAEIEVKSSEIMEDGTIIQSTDKGRRVIGREGRLLKGKEASDAIKSARAEKVTNAQKISGARVKGKDAAKGATKAIKQSGDLRANNGRLREVIRLIEEEGAETGPLSNMLPTVRSASIKLQNMQSELGLDVVGAVTFGALSKGELDLALSKALPLKLDGPDLVEWTKKKIAAQEKLANYLEDQAIYLDEPGNSLAGWLRLQKESARRNPVGNEDPAKNNNTQSGVDLSALSMEELIELRKQAQ